MNDDVPFIWRKNYRNEMASPEQLLEIAHEKARQYLSRAAAVATKSMRQPRASAKPILMERRIFIDRIGVRD